MRRRVLCLSLVVVASAAVVAVACAAPRVGGSLGGFSSLRAAAASISGGCAKQAGLGLPPVIAPGGGGGSFALWTRQPLVAAVASYGTDRAGTSVDVSLASSRGQRVVLSNDILDLLALWPCRRPVAFYSENRGQGNKLWMQALGARGPVSLGKFAAANPVFDSHGTLVEPPRSPLSGWRVARFAPPPGYPSVSLAEVERDCSTGTGEDTGRLYVISSAGKRKLSSYDSCSNPPLALWSPDGLQLLWASYGGHPVRTTFHVANGTGGAARTLATVKGNVSWALWSPDGHTVAYTDSTASTQVAEIDVRTGAVRHLTHISWTPTPPPRQPPYARVIGWSPDSKNVLMLVAAPNGAETSVESVPATGGTARVLIRLPQ